MHGPTYTAVVVRRVDTSTRTAALLIRIRCCHADLAVDLEHIRQPQLRVHFQQVPFRQIALCASLQDLVAVLVRQSSPICCYQRSWWATRNEHAAVLSQLLHGHDRPAHLLVASKDEGWHDGSVPPTHHPCLRGNPAHW